MQFVGRVQQKSEGLLTQDSLTYPSTGFVDLLRLLGWCVRSFATGPRSFDFDLTFQDWLEGLVRRTGSENVVLNLYFRKFLVVTGRDLSAHILAQPPDNQGYMEGRTKAQAMSFLAPQALTITHGEQWRRLRQLNETALRITEADERTEFIVDAVREAFHEPVSDIGDIRKCMAQAMRTVVFGTDDVPDHLVEDVQTLFAYVQNPFRRTLLGWSERGRRKRFYDALRLLWSESSTSGAPNLIAAAKSAAHEKRHSQQELLQQIPHWMFTFTGSGTDLLTRTLGMVTSRDDVYARVTSDAMKQGSAGRAAAVMNMEYLESCLLETCRLFPPVTRTLCVAPRGDSFDGVRIPAGIEILLCFTASQRDLSVDATANHFRPDRWMEPGSNADAVYPSLFLGGARNCPGKYLILLVCKAAISSLIELGRVRSQCPELSEDPVPSSFPESGFGLRMHTDELVSEEGL